MRFNTWSAAAGPIAGNLLESDAAPSTGPSGGVGIGRSGERKSIDPLMRSACAKTGVAAIKTQQTALCLSTRCIPYDRAFCCKWRLVRPLAHPAFVPAGQRQGNVVEFDKGREDL